MKKIAIFASGSGSDMQSVIDGIDNGIISNAKVDLLVASKDDIFAIERAKKHNIDYKVFKKADFESTSQMYVDIIDALESRGIDLIVLAGYLTILTPNIVQKYENRIINIHPSLIPKYCGMGFYGMKVHNAVIKAGECESGCTVHFVDEGADTGKIIMQDTVKVLENDTAETLQKRVLELEHKLLPKAVNKVVNEMLDLTLADVTSAVKMDA